MTFYSAMKSKDKIVFKKLPSRVEATVIGVVSIELEIDRPPLTLLPKYSHKT